MAVKCAAYRRLEEWGSNVIFDYPLLREGYLTELLNLN